MILVYKYINLGTQSQKKFDSYGRATPKNARVSACVGAPNELHQRSVCVHVCAAGEREEDERARQERIGRRARQLISALKK